MTIDEAKKAFDEMRAQGADDNAILGTLYRMFQDDKIDVEQLGALVNILGYELTDEFKQMTPEDQKTKGWEADDENEKAEGVTDEEVEKAKEYGDDPDERSGNASDEKSDETDAESDKKDEEESDEEATKKARKIFGLD
nr:MAG TPA: hypothetical protein [Caudoviricetes sp.]